jgi:hypothetical protein
MFKQLYAGMKLVFRCRSVLLAAKSACFMVCFVWLTFAWLAYCSLLAAMHCVKIHPVA